MSSNEDGMTVPFSLLLDLEEQDNSASDFDIVQRNIFVKH